MSDSTIVLCIDIQDKLFKVMHPEDRENIIKHARAIIFLACYSGWPIWVTEQYPKGLGATIPEISSLISPKSVYFEKLEFNACMNTEFMHKIRGLTRNASIIMLGIEAHICVYLTAVELKEKGFLVTVLSDGISSRSKKNYDMAIIDMYKRGITVLPTETVLFKTLKSSTHPLFKDISRLIK